MIINEIDLYQTFNAAEKAYEDEKYEKFGKYLGQACYKILVGQDAKTGDLKKNTGKESADARQYFDKMGSEFLTGFYFGVDVGAFSEKDMYECVTTRQAPCPEGTPRWHHPR